MTGDQAHRDHAESVGAYALGALPALETQVFERHLMGCELCQGELQRLTEAVEVLPRSVTPLEPPPSLKASLMEAVNADASRARPARERRRFSLPRLRPAVAFAAVGAACLLAGFAVSELARDDGDARTLSAQVDRPASWRAAARACPCPRTAARSSASTACPTRGAIASTRSGSSATARSSRFRSSTSTPQATGQRRCPGRSTA